MRSSLLSITILSLAAGCVGTPAEDLQDTTSTSSGDETEGSGDDTDDAAPQGYAHGLTIQSIVVNQGVEVPLWVDGEAAASGTPLISQRKTLVRAIQSVPEDWQERSIRGVLHVQNGDAVTTGEQIIMVGAGEPKLNGSGEVFDWVLPAELITPNTEFSFEFFEHEAEHLGQEDPAEPPVYPAEGTLDARFLDLGTTMKLVLIPIIDQEGDCVSEPEITEEMMEAMRLRILEINPVSEVEVELRDPIEVDAPIGDGLGGPLDTLVEMRTSDQAAKGDIYLGVTRACTGHTPNNTCIRGSLESQVAVVRAYDSATQTAEGASFCIEGSMGLHTVACPYDAGNVPPGDHPYPDGLIGSWGWSVVDHTLKRPDLHYSCVSNCGPKWISDYEWTKVAAFLSQP